VAFGVRSPLRGLDQPHHDGSMTSTLAPSLGDTVEVWLRVPSINASKSVHVRVVQDGEPTWVAAKIDRSTREETWWRAELPVANFVVRYRWLLEGPYRWINQLGTCAYDVTDAADFRLVAHLAPPRWAMGANIYQVFPDRFARDDRHSGSVDWPTWSAPAQWDDAVDVHGPTAMTQLFGGNLDGLASRVDHLTSLSIDAVYSTPIFPARSNHRYDAASFDLVDPLLGGAEALRRCLDVLHSNGIRFLGDITTNHCGVGHEWFRKAQRDPNCPEAQFFRFRSHPDDYECWFGVKSLPKFDYSSPAITDRLIRGEHSVVANWLREGFDGWRVDVANMTGRLGPDDRLHDVARMFRQTMEAARPDAFVVAEHAHDAANDLEGDGWYSTMNYAGFTNPVWSWLGDSVGSSFFGMPAPLPRHDGRSVATTIDIVGSAMSWRTRLANLNQLGSHDTPRFRSVVGGDRDRHLVGLGLLTTMPGNAMVFQGDEFAMVGDHTHLARSPLPWDRPDQQDGPTMAAYQQLLGLRRHSTALRTGGFRWVAAEENMLAYLRDDGNERILCLATRGSDSVNQESPALSIVPPEAELVAGGLPGGTSESAFAIFRLPVDM
jgi:alpha-glucosidase